MTKRLQFTDDQLVERYVQLRDHLAAEADAQAKYVEPYAKGMEVIAGELHRRLLERNPKWKPGVKASSATEHGTFFLKTTPSVKMSEREEFWRWLVDVDVDGGVQVDGSVDPAYVKNMILGRLKQFLTAHVAKEAVEAYIEFARADAVEAYKRANGVAPAEGSVIVAPPPGITVEQITTCQVRKA